MTVIAFIVGVVVLFVGIAVSIALHELGHLVPAKKFGIRVDKYMIGFGPTVFSRKRNGTEYGLKLLPLGGYISIAGMDPLTKKRPSPQEEAETASRVNTAPTTGVFKKMITDAQDANDKTGEGADPSQLYSNLSTWKKVTIMFGGPAMNLILAVLLFTIAFSVIGVPTKTTTVAEVSPCVFTGAAQTTCSSDEDASPAQQAGILPGDTIVSIDGEPITDADESSAIIQASAGVPLSFVVERDGQQLSPISITPVEREVEGEPRGIIGIILGVEREPQPITTGFTMAMENTGQVAGLILQLPQKLGETVHSIVTGEPRAEGSPMSVIGVGNLAGQGAAAVESPVIERTAFIISLLGSLNIALFVFNLIPLLPLDGGHIVVALWGGLKRAWAKLFRRPAPKPVDTTKFTPVTFVVVILLVMMGAILILADLVNPVMLFGG